MDQEIIERMIEMKPSLKAYRGKLETMKAGSYCIHRSWGLGRICHYDVAQNRLVIDFGADKSAHPMDPAFCIDKLDILPDTHVLVRYQKDSAAVDKQKQNEPVELILEVLAIAKDRSMLSSELEEIIKKLWKMGEEERAKKWWNQVKKLLAKDPRVSVPAGKIGSYTLREVPITPEQEILEAFYLNKNPIKKITLAEKLYQLSGSTVEIAQDLPQILQELTEAIQGAKQLKQADRLYGCWVRNDLARHLHTDVDQLQPTSKSIILATNDLGQLVEELPAHYYSRLLDLLTRVYPDQWEKHITYLFRNSSGRFTHECIVFLCDRGKEELVIQLFNRWLNEQALRASILHWIIKNRHHSRFASLVRELMTPRLLSAIFYAIDSEALQSASNRRIPLAELVSEDYELIGDLLAEASSEIARDLAQMLLMNQGFEVLTKRSVLARFIKQFPSIQNLVSGEAEQQIEQLFVSQASLDARKKEYEILTTQKLPENKLAIAHAREHGDLRENSEYKMARQDQETLLARKAQLEMEISRAQVINFNDANTDCVNVGSVVSLVEGSSGKTHKYAILGAWDSDPDKNILSYKTPLGQSLFSKKVGDIVKVKIGNNEESWRITEINKWTD